MPSQQHFEAWAPPTSVWSPWAKPVLFAYQVADLVDTTPPIVAYDTSWLARQSNVALIVNLPGADSVWYATKLLERGWRPVPLFNGCPGPNAAIATSAIVAAIEATTPQVAAAQLPYEAPPAFLIDSDRQRPRQSVGPGVFDNRWLVFAQDLPSGSFMKRHGIERTVVVQLRFDTIDDDLAHVLLRWKQEGIAVEVVRMDSAIVTPQPATLRQPSGFRQFWYRMLAMMRLRPNSTGGFGSVVPTPSSGGYRGYG
jgi:hypothetical protein